MFDVTEYPPMQGVIGTIADLRDDQHDLWLRDILTYASPTTGERVSTTYLSAGLRRFSWNVAGVHSYTWRFDGYALATVVGYRALSTNISFNGGGAARVKF